MMVQAVEGAVRQKPDSTLIPYLATSAPRSASGPLALLADRLKRHADVGIRPAVDPSGERRLKKERRQRSKVRRGYMWRVEVRDTGSQEVCTPVRRDVPLTATNGRGLGIVGALASRWGRHIEPVTGHTVVWFEVDGPPEPPGPR